MSSHRHRHHRDDPVQSMTPPSTASSSDDGVVNKFHKSYVDPTTGRHVDETIIESRDPETGRRRRKHKKRYSVTGAEAVAAAAAAQATSRGAEDTGYLPPPQAVYPGDGVSTSGSHRRSRRDRYESDSDSSGSSRSRSPPKRSNSLSRTLAKLGLVGGAAEAGHKAHRRRSASRGRSNHSRSSSSSSSRSRSRSHSARRGKHLEEAALVGASAGALAAQRERKKHRRRPSSRGHDSSSYDSDSDHHHHHRSRSRRRDPKEERERAAKVALATAAIQAMRSRKLPGGMTGEQGMRRVVEAAIASGGIEYMLEKRRPGDEHQRRHMIESIIGGLVGQRVLEGSSAKARSVSRGAHPSTVRYRSRSRGPSVPELAAGGVALYAGKQLYDRHKRSRSQQRGDSRSPDRHGRPRYTRQRSHSFPALLGAVGLGTAANEYHKEHRRRSRSRDRGDSRRQTMQVYRGDRGVDNDRDPGDGYPGDGYYAAGPPRSQTMPMNPQGGEMQPAGGQRGSDREEQKSYSEMSDDDPDLPEKELTKRRKKKKQREVVTAALAVLGVIGAAQKIYEGQEAHKMRKEMVLEGEISPAEAKRKRRKAKMKEAAALGLAGLALWEMYDDGSTAYKNHKDRVCFEEACKKRHNRVGEHVDKHDGKPDGNRRERKQIEQGDNMDYPEPGAGYAAYPYSPGIPPPMGIPAGGPAPAMPAYGAPPDAAYGIPPAGTYPVAAPPYSSPQPVKTTMKDGRKMTVLYPDHVSQAG